MNVFLLLAYSVALCSASASQQEIKTGPRIVNGFLAKDGRFPFVVAIYWYDSFNCGGTIISPKFIVTAGHCLELEGDYYIVAGTNDLGNILFRRKVENFIHHPEYSGRNFRYDIAVAKLDDALPMIPRKIMTAKLPEYSTEVPEEYGSVVGWGETYDERLPHSTLLRAVCLIKVPCLAWEEIFCLDDPEKESNKGSCIGDSGGPYLINRTLYGIVSHGVSKKCAEKPGRYTKVPYVVRWIKETAGLL